MNHPDNGAFAWRAPELAADDAWRFHVAPQAALDVAQAVRRAYDPDKHWFDYQVDDVALEPIWPQIEAGVRAAQHGPGLGLVHGLPRAELTEAQFELLSWCIGLRIGVARPQGKHSQYLAAVKNVGTVYRSAGGRGYSSNAELDFHVDGADLTTLACYNQAPVGGESMITSSVSTWQVLAEETPELAQLACEDFCFSRQQEQAPDEAPYYAQPLFDWREGRLFCKWNRNRIASAQQLPGVPPLSAQQRTLMDTLDEIIRRPQLMYRMYLQPGDLQIMNNHTMLHSRSQFEDAQELAARRMLVRLWLAPPTSVTLPDSWGYFYRSVAAGSVRGGILGHEHDARCSDFERRMAHHHGMTVSDTPIHQVPVHDVPGHDVPLKKGETANATMSRG